MNQVQFRLRVKPYTWNKNSTPVEGVVIMRGKDIKAFIPYEKVTTVTGKMIDFLEEHERENNSGNPDHASGKTVTPRKREQMITPAELPITVHHRIFTVQAPSETGPLKPSPILYGTICGLFYKQSLPKPVEGAQEFVCTVCKNKPLDEHERPTEPMQPVGHTQAEARDLDLEKI